MGRETKIFITTVDGKTITYPQKEGSKQQVWEATLRISLVDSNTGYAKDTRIYGPAEVTVFVTRETLEEAGLLPRQRGAFNESEPPSETAEDLLLRLLEHVGVYPQED